MANKMIIDHINHFLNFHALINNRMMQLVLNIIILLTATMPIIESLTLR